MALTKVARVSNIGTGTMALVAVGCDEIVLANVDGVFAAFGNECPHAGGPLAEGELAGEIVTCPWHASSYNVRTGELVGGPRTRRFASMTYRSRATTSSSTPVSGRRRAPRRHDTRGMAARGFGVLYLV